MAVGVLTDQIKSLTLVTRCITAASKLDTKLPTDCSREKHTYHPQHAWMVQGTRKATLFPKMDVWLKCHNVKLLSMTHFIFSKPHEAPTVSKCLS